MMIYSKKIVTITAAFIVLILGAIVLLSLTKQRAQDVAGNEPFALSPVEVAEFSALANRGDQQAAIRLARYYDLIALDKQAGTYWWEIAAAQGNASAQYALGIRLIDGGNKDDIVRGRRWLEAAANNGDKDAARLLRADVKGR